MHLSGWLVALLLIVGGVVVLNHLGVDLGIAISSSIHAVEHALGRPL